MSFDHSHYVANVRWKAAEREALQWLGRREKAQLTPLIELIPRNFQTKDGEEVPKAPTFSAAQLRPAVVDCKNVRRCMLP